MSIKKTQHKSNRKLLMIIVVLLILKFLNYFYSNYPFNQKWWKYESLQETYSNQIIYRNLLIFGTNNGELRALDLNKGKIQWTFPTQGSIYSIAIHDNLVIFGSMDNHLYCLNADNGKEIWQTQKGDFYIYQGSIKISANKIIMEDTNESLITYDLKSGKELSKINQNNSDSVICSKNYLNLDLINNYSAYQFSLLIKKFPYINRLFPHTLITASKNQGITASDAKTKKILWQYNNTGIENCPINWFSYLYFSDLKGNLLALNINNGKEYWKKETGKQINFFTYINKPLFYPRFFLKEFLIQKPLVYIGTNEGLFYALDGRKGNTNWSKDFDYPVNTMSLVNNKQLLLTSSNGDIYNFNPYSGKYNFFFNKKVDIKIDSEKIADNIIWEITLNHNQNNYLNPFNDIKTQAAFTHESGNKYQINGFYYDKDTWKVRFNPPLIGKYVWVINFNTPFTSIVKKGNLTSTTDTKQTFIKITSQNPKRLSYDNKTLFNLVGIGDSITDTNGNGNMLDDWSIGDLNKDTIINLEKYLDIYGKNGQIFNFFRWSVGNGSFIIKDFSINKNEYKINESKYGDTLVKSMKNREFGVWLTFMNWDIPFGLDQPIKIIQLKKYINYLIARYGAYADIWEITNEGKVDKKVLDLMISEIKQSDIQNRPISLSFEQPENENIDILSPHWYETEPLEQSDLKVIGWVNKFNKYNKPLIFGEQGNMVTNWDATSALRMRIRLWTAFFNEASMIFWNTSDVKNYHSEKFNNANIYLGDEERQFVKSLQSFVKDTSVDVKKNPVDINWCGGRAYGLESNKEQLIYIFHYANPFSPTVCRLNLNFRKEAKFEWFDPASGKIINGLNYPGGYYTLFSPVFNSDVALKVIFN